MSFEITGKIVELFDTQQVSDRFRKREFVVEYADNPQYPEFLKIECTQDKCDMLDGVQKNDEVTVSINLRGRAWTNPKGETVYFNSIQAWKISKATAEQNAGPEDFGQAPPPEFSPDSEPDDLPF